MRTSTTTCAWSPPARSTRPTQPGCVSNPSTGDGGTCYGDSGGPSFLGDSDVVAATTITGDAVCRATNVDYRLDTPSACDFLAPCVTLP